MKDGLGEGNSFSLLKSFLVLTLVSMIAACGGGSSNTYSGGGDSGGGSSSDDDSGPTTRSLGGGGVKGPLANALVRLHDLDLTADGFKGTVIAEGTTNGQAQIQGLNVPASGTPPFILEFTAVDGTVDVYTNQAPVITVMRTVVTEELLATGENIYSTPLTTMAVDLAVINADSDQAPWDDRDGDGNPDAGLGDDVVTVEEFLSALTVAATQVKSTVGFGMGEEIDIFDAPPLIDPTTDTAAEQEDAASYRAAVEAVTAVVAQINEATGTDDPNEILTQVTNDLADGEIDGEIDGQVSDIFDGDSDTADAALELFEQDPSTLPIPNSPTGQTVGEIKDVLDGEKDETGNDGTDTEIDTTEEVELKPAETDPDLDDDGTPNDKDAFPEDPTEQKDTDKDGVGNNEDTDDDGDGVADDNDAFPLNPQENKDTDNDGIGNNEDTDDDGDGVADADDDFPLDGTKSDATDVDGDGWSTDQDTDDNNPNEPVEAFVDTDGDGLANSGGREPDDDDDNDGVPDDEDAFDTDPTESSDIDGDGFGDNKDDDIDGDGVPNHTGGDTVANTADNAVTGSGADKFPRNPFEAFDTDRDGIGNNTDEDDDGDGVPDSVEENQQTNPLKRDTDGDGVMDNVDEDPLDPDVQFDSDRDGIDNREDNCAVHYNPLQRDLDGDGRGDACDKDMDGDGVENSEDDFPQDDSETIDSDNDGIGNNADNDDDNDGVEDANDAFPTDPNEKVDTDGDGVGNNEDTDDDGDGTEDAQDAFPLDSSEDTDTDGDGIGNNTDDDDDGDGVADVDDAFPLQASASTDTDGDGVPNVNDDDDDGDGVADVDDAFPLNANETIDTDGDGIGNNTDTDDDNDGVSDDNDKFPTDPNEYLDTDGDGIGNKADTDDDGDGVADVDDPFPLNGDETADTDGDGIGNAADTDDDNDGVLDVNDASPLNPDGDSDGIKDGRDNCPTVANQDQLDSDRDGSGNACDTDDDNDTILDDAPDNCPVTPNQSQLDSDGDNLGDACDSDRDGDGVNNKSDNCPLDANADQADADSNGIGDVCDADADQDQIPDAIDNCPADANSNQADFDNDGKGDVCDTDDDNDGVSDTDEVAQNTDPKDPDTDGDGVNDRADAFPTDPNETKDSDGDGTGDNADTDGDNDGINDDVDNCPASPGDPADPDQTDTDNDGKGNICDSDDDGDGVPDKNDAFPLNPNEQADSDGDDIGDNGDNCPAIANADQADADQDGAGDVCDADRDNDGVANAQDNCPANANPGQINTDGADDGGDVCDTDDDNDGTNDDQDNCPLVSNDQTDTDQDGKGDACDTDDDNDGLSDVEEGILGTSPTSADSDSDGTNDGSDNCPVDANAGQDDMDTDGVGDTCDIDIDGDEVLNVDEAGQNTSPTNADTDDDGTDDGKDNCPATANADQRNTDNADDGGDACDTDDDNDGVEDDVDNCPTVSNADQANTNGTPLGDACIEDTDDDGVPDAIDNCPAVANADQANADQDTEGDVCDTDDDNDSVADANDNCPVDANEDQADLDGDGAGDVCDSDKDGDTVENILDNCPAVANQDQLNSDDDGLGNACDTDDDNDGMSDVNEPGQGTDPLVADSDSDGANDGDDNCPVDANQDQNDLDQDGLGDVCDSDDDNDGVADDTDNCPVHPNASQSDADGNGVGDACDVAQVAGFYIDDSTVAADGVDETPPADPNLQEDFERMCGKAASENFVQVAHIEQNGEELKFSFAPYFDGKESGEGTINLANEIVGGSQMSRDEMSPAGMAITISSSVSFDGALDPNTGVITGTLVEENAVTMQGQPLFSCTYTSAQIMTPMTPIAAGVVMDPTSDDEGYVFMEADEEFVEELHDQQDAEPTIEFEYGVVNSNGEAFYIFNPADGTWPLETETDSSLMLGANGWALVDDSFNIDVTSGSTAVATREDASGNVYEEIEISLSVATIDGEPMADFVPEMWRDYGLSDISASFVGSAAAVKALAIEVEQTADSYNLWCGDNQFDNVNLECENMVATLDSTGEPVPATAISDLLNATGSEPSDEFETIQVGWGDEGAQLRAYLTGSDTSGAAGSEGTVSFIEMSGDGTMTPIDSVTATWSISDPFNSGDTVLEFTIPEDLMHQWDVEDEGSVILAVVADPTEGDILRIGSKQTAGGLFREQGLNVPGIEEVKANFSYTAPDFDADTVIDIDDNCPATANTDQTDDNGYDDAMGQGDACEDPDGDGDPIGSDDDNDNDGEPDISDDFPFDPDETTDTDGDGIGNNADTDDDNDGISDDEELANGTNPLKADTDDDTVNDDVDNCPTIANGDQTDTDSNGVGDACEGTPPDVAGFWLIERTITATNHTGDTSYCEGAVNDVDATIVKLDQEDVNVNILFADNEFESDGDHATISPAGAFAWDAEESENKFGASGFDIHEAESWSFAGDVDSLTTPTLIADTTATEVNTFNDGENGTGTDVAVCEYTFDASLTRMDSETASDVLSTTGTHQGYVWMFAEKDHIEQTGAKVYEFDYSIIDENGERQFEWDGTEFVSFVGDADYIFSPSSGNSWTAVADNFTPANIGATADLNRVADSTTYVTLNVEFFVADVTGLPVEGFVPEGWLEGGLPDGTTFAATDSAAFGGNITLTTDHYVFGCDGEDFKVGLTCSNAQPLTWPVQSQTDLVTSLNDMVHVTSSTPASPIGGVWVGRTRNDHDIFAWLTGSTGNASETDSGDVAFYTFDKNDDGGATPQLVASATSTWSVEDPLNNDSDLVLVFTLPNELYENPDFEIEWDETNVVALAPVEAGDTQAFVRTGGFVAAGESKAFIALNKPAFDEANAGFDYTKPDTDSDGTPDDSDPCPSDPDDQCDTGGGDPTDPPADGACTTGDIMSGASEPDYDQAIIDCGDLSMSLSDLSGQAWYSDHDVITFVNSGTGTFFDRNTSTQYDIVWSLDQGFVRLTASDTTAVFSRKLGVLGGDSTLVTTKFFHDSVDSNPASTTTIDVDAVLSDTAPAMDVTAFDPSDDTTYYKDLHVNIFDSLGGQHGATLYFVNNGAVADQWVMFVYVDGDPVDISGGVSDTNVPARWPAYAALNFTLGDLDSTTPASIVSIELGDPASTTSGNGASVGTYDGGQDPNQVLAISVVAMLGTDDNAEATADGAGDGNYIASMMYAISYDPTDSDSDGIPDDIDQCIDDPQNTCDPNSGGGDPDPVDSDNDGVNDDQDPFPYDKNEWADSDEDGIGDNADDFPNDATEQFDTDGDGVGDNTDLCPLVASSTQGQNHGDTDGDGIGDECDNDAVPVISGVYQSIFTPDNGNTDADPTGQSCVPLDDGIEYSMVSIKQKGTQVWLEFRGSEDIFAGLIDANGDFTINNIDPESTTEFVGNYAGGVFTSIAFSDPDYLDGGGTCVETGQVAFNAGAAVTEETEMTGGGITWFEADIRWNDQTQQDEYEFLYGTISSVIEDQRLYNPDTDTWDAAGTETEGFVTANGLESLDDLLLVTGYGTSGETARASLTDLGSASPGISDIDIDLMELNIENIPMLELLGGDFEAALSDSDAFATGARAFITTITQVQAAYEFWCDDDWDDWFDSQSMTCNNIVPKDFVEITSPSGDSNHDPVPAESFDDVISTPAELDAMSGSTSARGIWVGEGDDYQLRAFLATDTGASDGANPEVFYVKEYRDGGAMFVVGEGTFDASGTVGSTSILSFSVPDNVQRLADRDDHDSEVFLFVDSDTIDGATQNVLRRGSVIEAGEVEYHLSFNSTARQQVLDAFNLTAGDALPQNYLDARGNGTDWNIGMLQDHGLHYSNDSWSDGQGLTGRVESHYLFDSSTTGFYTEDFEEAGGDGSNDVNVVDVPFTWEITPDNDLRIVFDSGSALDGDVHQYALDSDNTDLGGFGDYSTVGGDGIDYSFVRMMGMSETFGNPGFTPAAFVTGLYQLTTDWGFNLATMPTDTDSTDGSISIDGTGTAQNCEPNCVADGDIVWSFDSTDGLLTIDYDPLNLGADVDVVIWDGASVDPEFILLWMPSPEANNLEIGVPHKGTMVNYPGLP